MSGNTDLMKQKTTKRSIVPHFDGDFYTKYLAKTYDKAIKLTGWRKKVAEHALNGIQPGKMLDVGCGTGFILDMARNKGFEIHGVEPSEGMIEQANLKYNFEDNVILPSTADKLPYADGTFDFVFASGSLIYVPNIEDAARDIVRVMKTGSTLRIIDHSTPQKKNLLTGFVFLFTQASGYLIHDYIHYFSPYLKLVQHRTLGRGGYMQLFDFVKI
jgi:ubiquinone/menaquinone biosynthesis C-methylase UbiE